MNFRFNVSGDKGDIVVSTALKRTGGQWVMMEAGYTDKEGRYIDITKPYVPKKKVRRCGPQPSAQRRQQYNATISSIKAPDRWRTYVGKTLTIEGIFVRDPLPLLVADLDIVCSNTPMPDDQYILLLGDQADAMPSDDYGGSCLAITGTVVDNIHESKHGSEYVAIHLDSYELLEQVEPYRPGFIKLDLSPGPASSYRYAVLFAGANRLGGQHVRYWNDLEFMYSTLVRKYGFNHETITVLYADGLGINEHLPVDYAATPANLKQVFTQLKRLTTEEDLVILYTTGQGLGFYKKDPLEIFSRGAIIDRDGDDKGLVKEVHYMLDLNKDGDPFDTISVEEGLATLSGPIVDDEFRELFDGLKYKRMLIIMEQSFSGGFIPEIGTSKISVVSTGKYDISQCMEPNCDYDELSYYFISALNEAEPTGKVVSSDKNKDGSVSINEAFDYAVLRPKSGSPLKVTIGRSELGEETSLR